MATDIDQLEMTVIRRIARSTRDGKRPHPHVRYETLDNDRYPTLVGIDCKICGVTIMGQVEDERLQKVRQVNGRPIITKYVTLSRFGLYTEVLITFDDGSKHQTHMCRNCVQKLSDPDILEYVYACDLAQWLDEERKGRGSAFWHIAPNIVDRDPVSYEDQGGLQ